MTRQQFLQKVGLSEEQALLASCQATQMACIVFSPWTSSCWWSEQMDALLCLEPDTPCSIDRYLSFVHAQDLILVRRAFAAVWQDGYCEAIHRLCVGGQELKVRLCAVCSGEHALYAAGTVEKLSDTIPISSSVACLLSARGRVVKADEALAVWLGTTPERLEVKTLRSFLPPPERQLLDDWLRQLRLAVTPQELVLPFQSQTGEQRSLQLLGVWNQETRTAELQVRDVTEQTRRADLVLACEKARQLYRLKTDFYMHISHEFQTPMQVLLSSVQLMGQISDRQGEAGEPYRACLGYMEQNLYRLMRLTGHLLDCAKLSGGHYPLTPETCDLAELSAEVTASAEAYAAGRDLTLTFQASERPLRLTCDRAAYERILLNLLSNAIRNTAAGGRIDVELRTQGPYARLTVRDTGSGMPPGLVASLNGEGRFALLESGTPQGLGMGLQLIRSLVALHDGRIEVESELEQGTAFSVLLPIQAPRQISFSAPIRSVGATLARVELADLEDEPRD